MTESGAIGTGAAYRLFYWRPSLFGEVDLIYSQ